MAFVEQNWLLILVFFVSGAMLLWPFVQRRISPMTEIGNFNATHLVNTKDAVLLDLREVREFEGGKLPNAVHVPLSQLESRGAELAKLAKRPVVAYCATGNRSRTAGAALKKIGFAEIYHLHGGIRAWRDAGLPLEK